MKVREKIGFEVSKEMQEIMFVGQVWEVVRFENIAACDVKVAILREVPPNTACTRLETGAANADSESNPAVSSG